MNPKLVQLTQRIKQLEILADEVTDLVRNKDTNPSVHSELNTKGQRWYRGARELLVQQGSSSLIEFERHYNQILRDVILGNRYAWTNSDLQVFWAQFASARALVLAVAEEVESRELPLKTQLSFAISADEFEKALDVVSSFGSDEVMLRAAGVIARVALERHLWTVADTHGTTVEKNPPTKKKADVSDVLTTLVKESVLTPIQRSEMEALFAIANNCAHPKEVVNKGDVERLINRGRELASVIL